MKPSGSGFFFWEMFLIIDSILILVVDLVIISISSCFRLGRLYILRIYPFQFVSVLLLILVTMLFLSQILPQLFQKLKRRKHFSLILWGQHYPDTKVRQRYYEESKLHKYADTMNNWKASMTTYGNQLMCYTTLIE